MFKQQNAIQYFRQHEGVVDHMYLDVVGLVTIGVGFMLPNSGAAQTLNLIRRDTGATATAMEKIRDWESVHQCDEAKPCAAYEPFTKLTLPDSEIDFGLAARIQDFVRNLQRRFPDFDQFPDQAQLGILDMIYSLGPRGLFSGYPKFCAAVDAQDWKTCALEGVRRNVAKTRNDDLARLFLTAASLPLEKITRRSDTSAVAEPQSVGN